METEWESKCFHVEMKIKFVECMARQMNVLSIQFWHAKFDYKHMKILHESKIPNIFCVRVRVYLSCNVKITLHHFDGYLKKLSNKKDVPHFIIIEYNKIF